MDSPLGGNGFELQFRDSSLPPTACGRLHSAVSGDSSIRRDSSTGLPTPDHCSDDTAAPTVDRRSSDEPTKPFPIYAELNVRIHSAPADSLSLNGNSAPRPRTPAFHAGVRVMGGAAV